MEEPPSCWRGDPQPPGVPSSISPLMEYTTLMNQDLLLRALLEAEDEQAVRSAVMDTNLLPTGKKHPKSGRPIYEDVEGRQTTERSVTMPRGGMWWNAPSFWDGKFVDEDMAFEKALESQELKGPFPTEQMAVLAAIARSRGL